MSTNLFAFIQRGARTLTVAFQGYEDGAGHTYLTTDDNIKPGDMVVVPYTPKSGPARLSIGTVLSADRFVNISVKDTQHYKWVVQRVDQQPELARREREAAILELIESSQRKRAIRKLVDETKETLNLEDSTKLSQLIDA